MKPLIKILLTAIIIFVFLFITAYVAVVSHGKAILTKQIENLTQRKVNIGYVGLTLPFDLEIRNLNIAGLAEVGHIFVSPSIIGLLSGNIVLNNLKLIRPKLIYERTKAVTLDSSGNTTITASPQLKGDLKSESKTGRQKKQALRLIFKHLSIKDGSLDFSDHTLGGEGIKIIVKDINFNLTNLYLFPCSAITNFAFSGRIPWQEGQKEGTIEAEGWLNVFKKDMQATLKIQDINGVYLYPYYSAWVDLEKARIEKAKLNLTSNIHSLDNNLAAECHLELTDIVFKVRPDEENQDKAEKIAVAVMDVFKALNKGKIILNFTIRTKMVSPQFSMGDVKDAFEQKLAEAKKNSQISTEDLFRVPGKVAVGTVKGATDLSKALIDGTFSIAKELKEAVEYAFKKEPKGE